MTANVYIGYDKRESEAYRVALQSLRKRSSVPLLVTPLDRQRLAENGLLRRPMDMRGQMYDFASAAPCSCATLAMPQAIERSLATPMMRPRLPASRGPGPI